MNLAEVQFNRLRAAVEDGLRNASAGMSAITTGGVALDTPAVTFLPLNVVPGIAGGPESVVTAVYLGVEGDVTGHLMLLFTADSACAMVDLLLEQPPGTTADLDGLALSALAEAGNICGSGFLNAMANRTGLCIIPTTPAVISDMAGAILQQVVSELYMAGDEALVVETGFNGAVRGHFLLMPDGRSMSRLLSALEALG